MKRKIVAVILGSAIMLAVVACGKDETVETMNTDTVEEENVSDETVVEENVTEETKEEIEDVVVKEDVNDPLSQDNIIQLDDGTYDFTDDFLGTVMSYDYFAGSTEQEVKDYLNEIVEFIKDKSPEEISESLGALGFSTGSTLKQDTTNQNQNESSETGVVDSNDTGSTSNQSGTSLNESTTQVSPNYSTDSSTWQGGGVMGKPGTNFGGDVDWEALENDNVGLH